MILVEVRELDGLQGRRLREKGQRVKTFEEICGERVGDIESEIGGEEAMIEGSLCIRVRAGNS